MTGLTLLTIGIVGLAIAIIGLVIGSLKAILSFLTFRIFSFVGSVLLVLICAGSIPLLVLLMLGGGTLSILGI